MTIEIRRYRQRKETIDGKVYIDGKKVCDCAENARHCLALGTHQITHTRCVREDRNIPLIGHSACPHNCQQCNHLAHGNGVYGGRTGSILLGEFIAPGCVKHSKPAFNALCERIRKAVSRGHEIELKITDPLPTSPRGGLSVTTGKASPRGGWVGVLLAILSVLSAFSCSTSHNATQLVHHIRADTVYMKDVQYDSIYIYKDRVMDRTTDTVYVKDVSIEYRYRLLRDTIHTFHRDSIPYEVTVTETREIVRPLTWFDHLTRACFWIVIGILFITIAKTITNRKSRIV